MAINAPERPAAGYALVYREACIGRDNQQRAGTELRGRAGALTAAAAITTSFFGGQVLVGHEIGAAAWVAIACFVLLCMTVLLVLWPRRDWTYSLAPDELITTYIERGGRKPIGLHVMQRDLALHIGRSTEFNRRQLQVLTVAFRAAALLLVTEVMAWVVALLTQT
jgi:hypothetical protein